MNTENKPETENKKKPEELTFREMFDLLDNVHAATLTVLAKKLISFNPEGSDNNVLRQVATIETAARALNQFFSLQKNIEMQAARERAAHEEVNKSLKPKFLGGK